MYEVDKEDRVVELTDIPQCSVGAPIPFLMADEHELVLAYYLENIPEGWDGTEVRMVGPTSSDEPIAIVRFQHCYASMFGPPNDEAFSGHPLASRGLTPYAVFRIENSSWVRRLERMNSVHEHHNSEQFRGLQHLVWAFHDSVFECICKSFDLSLTRGSIENMMPEMRKKFNWGAG